MVNHRIGETPGQSLPDWPGTVQAPASAPNILLVMTDDVGFATSAAFVLWHVWRARRARAAALA